MGEPCGLPSSRTWRVPLEVSISSAPSTFRSASAVWLERTIAFRTSRTRKAASSPRTTLTQVLTIPAALARADAELVGLLGQRLDDQRHVLVGVDPELLDPALHLAPVDCGGEGRLLQLLLDGLRLHALDPGRPHQRAGGDEPRELVDGEQGLGHLRLARDLEELGVAGDRIDDVLGVVAALQLLDRVAGVARVEVGVALVVEVVDERRDRVALLVLIPLAGVRPHGRLDARGGACEASPIRPIRTPAAMHRLLRGLPLRGVP